MVRAGLKAVVAGMNPMDLKRGIDKAVEAAVAELKAISKPCSDNKEIVQVGTISANADESIGEIIAEAMAKLAGGLAGIKVGASTEIETKEKKARVEDALHATRAAVEEGIVPRRWCCPGAGLYQDRRAEG